MLKLTLPNENRDRNVVKSLCKSLEWHPYQATWLAAYDAYESVGGDPHRLTPAKIDPKIADAQFKLYDTRKSGGPIRRISDRKGILCCPMCGSGSTGDVDHYLPRKQFPEFSIFAQISCQPVGTATRAKKAIW
jgi:hypothetical protein